MGDCIHFWILPPGIRITGRCKKCGVKREFKPMDMADTYDPRTALRPNPPKLPRKGWQTYRDRKRRAQELYAIPVETGLEHELTALELA